MQNVIQINGLLQDLNNYDISKNGTAFAEEVEGHIVDYLKQNESDLATWYKLVLLDLVCLHDEESAIKYLRQIHNRFQDDVSIIMICFIQDEFQGGFDEKDFKLLQAKNSNDRKLSACQKYYMSTFYRERKDFINYTEKLSESILLYENYTHAYIEMGQYFRDEKKDMQMALSWFNKALNSVQKVLTLDEIENGTSDLFDLQGYFDEMIYGNVCTYVKYDYIETLAKTGKSH